MFVLAAAGCQSARPKPTSQPLSQVLEPPYALETVRAVVTPPVGWRMDPLKKNARTLHQVWVSPSGRTAYGVIHFTLPLPVSANFLMPFYMRAWRKDQGEARLLLKVDDPALPGVRFVAEGGLYRTWTNLTVSGLDGWAIYAGVLRAEDVNDEELLLAEQAREHTVVGLPSDK